MGVDDNRQEELQRLSDVSGEQVRIITARAVIEEMNAQGQDEALIAQALKTASAMPMVTDGEPTKLLVTAWMVHEGKNNNNLVFRAQDLEAAAAKISAPNFLPMDWNHSAVVPVEAVPKAIGVWYSAEVAWDAAAYEGKGAKGIVARGVVWAWAFPEYAAEMMQLQREKGYIEFSMACIPTNTERGRDQNGPYEVAIEPVFFTLSALNVPPGDPDAKGLIENVGQLPDETQSDWWDQLFDGPEAPEESPSGLELETVAALLTSSAKDKTNFPARGDNKQVSLRNSQWKLFPVAEATDLKDNWPEIWKRGGNVRGNDQFRRLVPVAKRGGRVETATDEYAVRLREAWVARHYEDHQLAGVVAQVKWLAVGSRGLDHMRSVLNEAKQRVKAHRVSRTYEEEHMENASENVQTALDAALEVNATLKAELEVVTAAKDDLAQKMFDLEESLVKMAARAEEAELKRDALQSELANAVEQLTAVASELATANDKLATTAAEQQKQAVEQRWTARLSELPESYRAAFAKRSEEEQARFVGRWSVASDEAWTEFKSDLFVGLADTKISYLKLSEEEGALPNGGVTEMSVKIASLIK